MSKMKPEIKKMWIDALRSDNYDQTQGHLCEMDINGVARWCCLGVLTDLAIKNGVDIDIERSAHFENILIFDQSSEILSPSVMEWAGMESSSGDYTYDYYEGDYLTSTLVEDNDNGQSFRQIADTIEMYF
jgi:hypothetical protein